MNLKNAQEVLKKYYGYEKFRPLQAEIIQNIYEQKDALVLMPTGGGKSICYQIPAVTLPGTCVVISPLISLMKDQVESLKANGIKAAFLNSTLDANEQRVVEDQFFHNQIDLLYVSPEKLVSSNFTPLLQRAKICLFAIDEAHCISAWGHDFRPEYRKMKFLKRDFPNIPLIALTATADKVTRKDIVKQLNVDESSVFIASFDRPNLSLEVRPGQKRFEQIIDFLEKHPKQAGIIYCLSRKSTEDVAKKLQAKGLKAKHYHAGMSDVERSNVQEAFINDHTPIICATIAFGMGIDKSNVRWIIHYNLPKNIESYYQEIGRAGRDGATADTLLFYSYADVMMLQDIISKGEGDNQEIQETKLKRMRQYAESLACRRRMLLNYFGENSVSNCNNCDICKNPPTYFDGTIIAQKALSAVYRLQQKVAMGMLIDVLRASGKREVLEKGYHKIKTYGAGRDIPYSEWQYYLQQLLNLGYIEVAHDQKNLVKLTPSSKRILFEKVPVQLVKMSTFKERQKQDKEKTKPKTQRQRVRDELFEHLRQLRRGLAQEKGVPPYIIFSDATLEEMAAIQPMNDQEMQKISGVGERKLHLYGSQFIDAITEYLSKNSTGAATGSTHKVTLNFFQKGLAPKEIAEKRDMSENTIYAHLVQLYQAGELADISSLITSEEIAKVQKCIPYLEQPLRLKSVFEYLEGSLDYNKIRLALGYLQRS